MKERTVLNIGGDGLTTNDVETYFGISDSDESDWGDIGEVKANDFLEENKAKEIKTVKKVFQKVTSDNAVLKQSKITEIKKSPFMTAKDTSGYFVALPTQIRVMKPMLTQEIWKERIMARKVLAASSLSKMNVATQLSDEDWILVGVIAQRSGTKKTKTDKSFCTWMLTDLHNLDYAVRFMLFNDIYDALWKELEGTVVAILRPKLLKSDKVHTGVAFTVDVAGQVIILGQSPDYGICEGRKKSGEKCTNVVNKTDCGLCIYHIQKSYSAAMSRPGFSDIRSEKMNSRKRVAQEQDWKISAKKPKSTGIFVNNVVGPAMSIEKLHKAGVTTEATKWGLLDKSIVSKLNISDNPKPTVKESELSKNDLQFAQLLKKPGAGSMNFVKCLAEKSCGSSVISSDVMKRSRVFDNGRPSVAKNVTCADVLSAMKKDQIVRDDPQRYIDLGLKPVDLSKVSAEVYRAELAKLRFSALAKSKGGFLAFKESNRLEHLKTVGKEKETVEKNPKKTLSAEMLALLHQRSSNKHLQDQSKDVEREKMFDSLEKVEKMEMKMASIHECSVFFYFCNDCNVKTPGYPKICALENHKVDRVKGLRRFFRCLKCKHRLNTLEKYPNESCFKCGAAVFEKTGMFQENVSHEKALVDGGEKRFINN